MEMEAPLYHFLNDTRKASSFLSDLSSVFPPSERAREGKLSARETEIKRRWTHAILLSHNPAGIAVFVPLTLLLYISSTYISSFSMVRTSTVFAIQLSGVE